MNFLLNLLEEAAIYWKLIEAYKCSRKTWKLGDKPSEGDVFLVYNQKQYPRANHPEYMQ